MERWPGWEAHVVEHHLAQLQLQWGRRLRRWQAYVLAAPPPLLRAVETALLVTLSMATANKSADAAARVSLLGAWRLLPYLALVSICCYAWRLACHAWLRQEWRDLLQHWRSLRAEEATCPICAEQVPATAWHLASMPCCGGVLCWACVRRHAESVIDDARPEMRCPLLPCRSCLPDVQVFAALRREQWSWRQLDLTGSLARRKRRVYERWVLTCGLAESCSARAEDVVHCPTEDCDHMWVLPREMRARKDAAEPHTWWNPQTWSLGRYVGLYAPTVEEGRDLRHVHCPKCNRDYCLLCSLPWNGGSEARGHEGKSCIEHSGSFPQRRERRSKWAGAKPCPGCGVRIIRSMGCNKMTCTRCGSVWCWACLSDWQPVHYGCSEVEWREDSEDSQCSIL